MTCDLLKMILWVGLLGAWGGVSLAQNSVDRAFDLQNAPSRNQLSVDSSVHDTRNQSQQNTFNRFSEIEQARREEMQRYSQTKAAKSESDSNSQSRPSASSSRWNCEFLCGKTSHTVWVTATIKTEAQDLAMQYGKSNCWSLSKQLYQPMWGRIAACEKQ